MGVSFSRALESPSLQARKSLLTSPGATCWRCSPRSIGLGLYLRTPDPQGRPEPEEPDSFQPPFTPIGVEGKMHTIGLSLASLLLTTTPEVTPPVSTYTLTVALFNDARVSPTVLAGAQESVSQIFWKSGIQIHWMLCGHEDESPEERSACSRPEFPNHLDVHVVGSCPRLPISVFGISYLSPIGIGSQADVFYAKIAAFRQSPAAQSTLLGYAMA